MPLTVTTSKDDSELTIHISDRFDFGLHHDFREATTSARQKRMKFIIDMAGTEYMDSSALGMLLLLREDCGGDASHIRIVNCEPNIGEIFKIANFDKLFEIT